jgi:hypothetical protein
MMIWWDEFPAVGRNLQIAMRGDQLFFHKVKLILSKVKTKKNKTKKIK